MSLAGRRFLITGVATKDSIAFATAARLQEAGAEVLLTSFGRMARLTTRAAARLPDPPEILDWDASEAGAEEALREQVAARWDRLDGVLHAVAFAPSDALGGGFLDTPPESAEAAFRVSAYSLKALASGLAPLMGEGGSVVGLTFDGSRAWPVYDWMGVAKAALESVARYCARELGPERIRVNLVAAGPLATLAAQGIPGFDELASRWREGAPLGWDTGDPGPVADAACFLLSPAARGITGEILHVDGGFHALGAPGGWDRI
jgi:enoyl ACP reductase